MKKKWHLKLTFSGLIPVVCFLGAIIIGLPLIIEEIFLRTENSVHTTQYIFLCYLAFLLLLVGLIVPIARRILILLKSSRVNVLDGFITIALIIVSIVPLIILWLATFALIKNKLLIRYRYKVYNFAISAAILLLGAWVVYHGRKDKKGRIIIANHTSPLDYLLICQAMGTDPWNIVAGINLRRNRPTLGDKIVAATIGKFVEDYAIAIDRKDENSKLSTALKIVDEIDNGINVAIFPEGTRTPIDKIRINHILLQDFANGAFRIAWSKKIPIQPLVLDWPAIWRGKGDDWWGIHPCRIDAHFLEIVDPSKFQYYEEFKTECWSQMYKKLLESCKIQRFLKS